jgi:hypothetical protein
LSFVNLKHASIIPVKVTINEVREHGGFGEQWTPPKAEVRALASLKFLKLIVTRNGTFVSTRAWAMGHSAEVSRAVMESSSSTTATSAAAAPTVRLTKMANKRACVFQITVSFTF